MCVEVYHSEVPLVVPYEIEILRLTGERSFKATHALLVQNVGHVPISTLNVLYPRMLYEQDGTDWVIPDGCLRNATADIRGLLRGVELHGDELVLAQQDPNRPQFARPPLAGTWLPDDFHVQMPKGFPAAGLSFLAKLRQSFFQLRFEAPINPRQARWIGLEFDVLEAGVPANSLLGNVVIHQLASPVDVRRTVDEQVECAQRTGESDGPRWLGDLANDLREFMGLKLERRVEIQYYELVLRPGNPAERLLLSWEAERDIRLRSGSPRKGENPALGEDNNELIYEWKSGSLLKPDSNPWRNLGFVLHLTLLCR